MDQAGTLVGVVSVIPEFGWSDHVGQLRLLVDPGASQSGIMPLCRSRNITRQRRSRLPPALSSQP